MFIHNLNPVLASIGPIEIRWYGLMYVIAFILGYFMLIYLSKKKYFRISKEQVEDLLVYAGVAGIIGARISYVLFYNLTFYIQNPLEIFAVWHGGLGFHGSLIGGMFGVYLFCRKYKFNMLEVLDAISIPFVLGLALGRIGNFINGELYGRLTSVPWCVNFPGAEGCRHPSQIYESLKNFAIFAVLWIMKGRKLVKGAIFAAFVLMYSSFRFAIEFFREPDVQIGFIGMFTLGQLINIAMFAAGLILLYAINRNIKKK